MSGIIVALNSNQISGRKKSFKAHHYEFIYAFYKTICRGYGHLTWTNIAKLAEMSRTALYNHFANMNRLFCQGIEFVLTDFGDYYNSQEKKYAELTPDNNTRALQILLAFLSRHKKIFKLICGDLDHQSLLYRMVEALFPRFELSGYFNRFPTPDINDEKVSMAITILVKIISEWGVKTCCNVDEEAPYIKRMLNVINLAEKNMLP